MKSVLYIFFISLSFATPKSDFKPSPTSRGDFVAAHAIPYMVLLHVFGTESDWYCGGTLISQNYVLSAPACISGMIAARLTGQASGTVTGITVKLGAHFVHRPIDGEVDLNTTEIIYHENYQNYTNDIAAIKLPQPVEYSSAIQPALLPKKSDVDTNYQGVVARVSGWGSSLMLDVNVFEIPRYSFVEILDNDDESCNGLGNPFPDTMLCASGTYEGEETGPNFYDEGGPLIINGVLIGIISFGYDLIWWEGLPGAYTRVASYLDWIEANTDVVIV